MSATNIFSTDYRPHFTGHETFPLRYGWLKKAYEKSLNHYNHEDIRQIFTDENAIAEFGVGKNMVASIRHWATSANVLTEQGTGQLTLGPVGIELFDTETGNGLDPYLENPSSLWLIHWHLCTHSKKTTWKYVFGHFQAEEFDRASILDGLLKLGTVQGWQKLSAATIKRDVECFLRSYVAKPTSAKSTPEDILECPLAELGLIKMIGKRDNFRLARGPKPTLGNGVFLYALVNFWHNSRHQGINQLPFESIAYDPGSPGRIFLLDENEVASRLMNIENVSNGVLSWSETSGIRAIILNSGRCLRDNNNLYGYLHADYE